MKLKIKKYLICGLGILMLSTPLSIFITSCSRNDESSTTPNTPVAPPPTSPSVPSSNVPNPIGGNTTTNLSVDKYLNVINTLKLTNKTDISQLTNDILNNSLHSIAEYQSMQLSIVSGSQINGQLTLKLTGQFDTTNYDENIVISGFEKHDVSQTFTFGEIVIDKELWFNNFQPISGVNNNLSMTSDKILIKNIFTNTSIAFTINGSLESYKLNNLPSYITIKDISITKNGTNYNLDITFNNESKKFENNQWVIEQTTPIIATRDNQITLPTFNELKKFMIDQLVLKEDELSKYYASFFYGKYLYDKDLGNNLSIILDYIKNGDEIINKYKEKYCPNKTLSLILPNQDFGVDDYNGSLRFNVALIDQDDPSNIVTQKTFEYTGFKHLTNLVDGTAYNNQLMIKSTSSFATQIIKFYSTRIKEVFTSHNSYQESLPTFSNSFKNIYNFYDPNKSNQITKNQDLYISMQIFGTEFRMIESANDAISKQLNINNGLFNMGDNDFSNNTFYIEGISYLSSSSDKITISYNVDTNRTSIEITTSIEIILANGESTTQNATIYLSLVESEIPK